jgi:hypothetical protein
MGGDLGLEEEPLYVNAKQYHRILKRRQARARLEAQLKIQREKVCHILFNFVAYKFIRNLTCTSLVIVMPCVDPAVQVGGSSPDLKSQRCEQRRRPRRRQARLEVRRVRKIRKPLMISV